MDRYNYSFDTIVVARIGHVHFKARHCQHALRTFCEFLSVRVPFPCLCFYSLFCWRRLATGVPLLSQTFFAARCLSLPRQGGTHGCLESFFFFLVRSVLRWASTRISQRIADIVKRMHQIELLLCSKCCPLLGSSPISDIIIILVYPRGDVKTQPSSVFPSASLL